MAEDELIFDFQHKKKCIEDINNALFSKIRDLKKEKETLIAQNKKLQDILEPKDKGINRSSL